MALTDKQQRFVEEYLSDLNAKQAAIRAGYSEKTAAEQGYQNLGKPSVADAIAAAKLARSERTQITADRVLEETARLALAEITDAMDWGAAIAVTPENGGAPIIMQGVSLVAAKDLPKHVRSAIAEVKQTKDGLSLKMHSKTTALDMLHKHLGTYKPERHEHSGPDGKPIETRAMDDTEIARRLAALVAKIEADAAP